MGPFAHFSPLLCLFVSNFTEHILCAYLASARCWGHGDKQGMSLERLMSIVVKQMSPVIQNSPSEGLSRERAALLQSLTRRVTSRW